MVVGERRLVPAALVPGAKASSSGRPPKGHRRRRRPGNSASRNASQTPSARYGSCGNTASPTSAQPRPCGRRMKAGKCGRAVEPLFAPSRSHALAPAPERRRRPPAARARCRRGRSRGRRSATRDEDGEEPVAGRKGEDHATVVEVELEPLTGNAAPVGEVPAGQSRHVLVGRRLPPSGRRSTPSRRHRSRAVPARIWSSTPNS